jgi:Flp pilus assembly protein TadG
MSIKSSIVTSTRDMLRDRRGNVAMILAAAIVPAVFAVGMGVDYATVHRAKMQLQAAIDSAALAAIAPTGLTDEERVALANQTFQANIQDNAIVKNAVASVVMADGSTTVSSTLDVPMAFVKIAGINSMQVGATTTVTVGEKKLEAALILDITGSMTWTGLTGKTKLEEMKGAVPDLLDILMPDGGTAGIARVSVIPFSNRVNVGEYVDNVTNYSLTTSSYYSGTSYLKRCVTERTGTQAATDEAPASDQWIKPHNAGDSDYGSSYTNSLERAKSCENTSGSGEAPKENAAILPLTADKSAILAKVAGLTADGGTAGHLGIAWGWYTLSPKWNSIWPNESKPAAYTDSKVVKAVVFMTDGEFNTDYSSGTSKDKALAICSAVRNFKTNNVSNFLLFTIGFGLDPNSSNESTQAAVQTMKDCAGSVANRYFFPMDETQLKNTFSIIGQQITSATGKTRLTN